MSRHAAVSRPSASVLSPPASAGRATPGHFTSEDARAWTEVRRVDGGDGGRDPLRLPEAEARYVRFDFEGGGSGGYGLAEVEVEPIEFGASPTAFVQAVASGERALLRSPYADAVRTLAVTLAANRSAEQGGRLVPVAELLG